MDDVAMAAVVVFLFMTFVEGVAVLAVLPSRFIITAGDCRPRGGMADDDAADVVVALAGVLGSRPRENFGLATTLRDRVTEVGDADELGVCTSPNMDDGDDIVVLNDDSDGALNRIGLCATAELAAAGGADAGAALVSCGFLVQLLPLSLELMCVCVCVCILRLRFPLVLFRLAFTLVCETRNRGFF